MNIPVWEDETIRGTGRTVAMLKMAREHADDGGLAVVVAASKPHVDELRRLMIAECGGIPIGVAFIFSEERHNYVQVARAGRRVMFFVDSHAMLVIAWRALQRSGR